MEVVREMVQVGWSAEDLVLVLMAIGWLWRITTGRAPRRE
jgi:hypothetical protein